MGRHLNWDRANQRDRIRRGAAGRPQRKATKRQLDFIRALYEYRSQPYDDEWARLLTMSDASALITELRSRPEAPVGTTPMALRPATGQEKARPEANPPN